MKIYNELRCKVIHDINGEDYYYFYQSSIDEAYDVLDDKVSEGYIVGFGKIEIIKE